jgi:glycosyltransferase involved in cell wall biosynthesis
MQNVKLASRTKSVERQPMVTVIMPVRNEAGFIARSLGAALAQDYPADRLEALLVDGRSTDQTRTVVASMAEADPRVRLLDNPAGIAPTALNIGIAAAKGEIIVRVDGHCIISANYVSSAVAALRESGANCVGGQVETLGHTPMGRAIAAAMTSPIGVGDAKFRYITTSQYVDTLFWGAYWRDEMLALGGFDEELVRNQDDEFNYRLRQAGGRILLDSRASAVYYCRDSIKRLWRQYYEYGFWKIRVFQKHIGAARWRHALPGGFVLFLLLTPIMLLLGGWPAGLALLGLGSYAALLLGGAIFTAARSEWRYLLRLPIIWLCLHLAYGAGMLVGLVYWNLRRPPAAGRTEVG